MAGWLVNAMWAEIVDNHGGGHVPQAERAAHIATQSHFASSHVSASLITQDQQGATAGQWYSDKLFLFNLSLTGRPASAQGRFEAMDFYRPVGELFFVPARQRYLARGGPGRQRTMFVEMQADERFGEDLDIGMDAPILRTCLNLRFDRLRDLLLRMAQEVSEPGFAAELLIEGLGVTLLAETLRVLRQVEAGSASKGGLSPWRLRAIEARIRDGANVPTLAELADLCGLSRRQLMRAFREETGRTVGSFVQEQMLERAKGLLHGSDMPIAEVATRAGFSSGPSFSTAFRRAIGESPRAFRTSRHH
jgi:AraC family transcriptional regulator